MLKTHLTLDNYNSSLRNPQVGPGHEARVQLELNSAPVLHIYDRSRPTKPNLSCTKSSLHNLKCFNQSNEVSMFNFIEPGNRCTYVHSSIAGLILSQIVKYLCRDYSQGRTVADRFSMFGQSVIVQMSVSTLHPHSFPPTKCCIYRQETSSVWCLCAAVLALMVDSTSASLVTGWHPPYHEVSTDVQTNIFCLIVWSLLSLEFSFCDEV